MTYLSRHCIVIICVISVWAALFLVPMPVRAQNAGADSIRISEYPIYDSLMPGEIVKFGIQSGFVFTPDLDMGMDCGGRISQRFFHPFFQLTSQVHFWVASNESTETAVVGLEESITYSIPIRHDLFWSGGFSIGYFGTYEDKAETRDGVEVHRRYQKTLNSIDSFIIIGVEHVIDRKRSIFVHGKFGKTDMGREYHLVTGINFYLGQ